MQLSRDFVLDVWNKLDICDEHCRETKYWQGKEGKVSSFKFSCWWNNLSCWAVYSRTWNTQEMVESMKNVAKLDLELSVEERNLLSVGYKNVIGARRASWRIMSSIEQIEDSKGNESNVKQIKGYCQKVEEELIKICRDILAIIDELLIPHSSSGEATVFYYKMKGDYYRYLAEFKGDHDKKEAADQPLNVSKLC